MKKRIVHITFDMGIGGTEKVICNLIENTDRSKYEVSIICLDQPIGPFGRQLQDKGYQIIAFDRKPGFDLSLVRSIHSLITRRSIDVLHCHQYTPYIYGLFGAAFTKAKVIFTEHGRFYPDQRRLKRIVLNPLFSYFTDYLTAISSATRNALIQYENFPRGNIIVIYNGIDDSRYVLPSEEEGLRQSLGINDDAFILGTVARLDPIKNQKMMIKALGTIRSKHPDTYLLIVGDGSERGALESTAFELGLSSHVLFTGFREDAYRYLKIMDIFLLTSFSEGTAMTLLEAMACSLPCIVTDVGGNPEIVKDQDTGFVVPSDDERALSETVTMLLRDVNSRKKMGMAGRKRFEAHFTAVKMVQSYQAMYDRNGNGKH